MRLCSAAGVLVLLFTSGMVRQRLNATSATQPLPDLQTNERDERVKVSVCELRRDPLAYNHKLIEVTGFISHGFEDFTLFDPTCNVLLGVWLEYGGTAASGTMYCCGVTAQRSRPQRLVVENISIELVEDDRFKQFDKLIQRRPDSVVHATIVGRFFSGKLITYGARPYWGGYGHMGCCSLLVIQEVLSVDPHDSPELDYGAFPDSPDLDDRCTGYEILHELLPGDRLIKAQQRADAGTDDWAFTDPQRVATEGLAKLLQNSKIDSSKIQLRQTGKAQGRVVYDWWSKGKTVSYMVVVSRPYVLSFYAKDPNRVAWVMSAAYKRSCGRGEE
jgi:hypothetical protein